MKYEERRAKSERHVSSGGGDSGAILMAVWSEGIVLDG